MRNTNDLAPPPSRPRILVVEDDFLIRMMLREMLVEDGYDVVEAESGDQAITLFDAGVALLLTDMQLPGSLDGRALAARVRQLCPDLPVIYTSGRLDLVALGKREMAIAKPYQNAEIRAGIKRMLAE